MARPIFIFLITLFLNTGTGNERLLANPQLTMPAGSAAARGAWLARQVDQRDTGRDSRLAMRMRLFDRQGRVRERALTVSGLRGGAGRPVPTDRTLIRFTEPADIRGTSFLVWEQVSGDDERFLYLPSIGRVRRIASSEAQESFVGSDFTYEDIGGREFDDYDYRLVDEDVNWKSADGLTHAAYRLESRRRDTNAKFPRVVSLVRKDSLVVVDAQIANRRDEVQKQFTVDRLERVGAYWTVLGMTMTDGQARTRTELIIENAEYDLGLGADDFSRRELERAVTANPRPLSTRVP